MTSPVPSAAPRSRFRALPLLGWALGVAGLVWGAVQVWQAQPAVAVSAQAVKAAPSPEPLEDVAFRALRGRLREPAAAAFQDVRVHRFGPPDERAVCGRVVAPRETPASGADFVVRVILPGGGRTGGAPLPVVEDGPNLPRATANARRRYCRDADDPETPGPRPTLPPLRPPPRGRFLTPAWTATPRAARSRAAAPQRRRCSGWRWAAARPSTSATGPVAGRR